MQTNRDAPGESPHVDAEGGGWRPKTGVLAGVLAAIPAFAGSAAAQTDSVPTGPGTSPLTYVVLAGLVAVVVQTQTGYDPLGRIRGLVGGDGDSGTRSITTNSSPGFGLGRPRTLVIAGVGVVVALVLTGALGLSESAQVQVTSALVLVGTYLVLRGLGAYSFRLFALVGAGVVVLGLSALGEPIIGAIAQSPVFPVLAIGALYVAYKAVQAYRESNKPPEIVLSRGENR